LSPAEPNTGIRFRRTDLDGAPEVPATLEHVVATELGTTIGRGDARVRTVEHLLAATVGLRIDNVVIDVSGQEVPSVSAAVSLSVFSDGRGASGGGLHGLGG
jgi:UDP-3-O-acyl-N-acetylglucosamine deacetylase